MESSLQMEKKKKKEPCWFQRIPYGLAEDSWCSSSLLLDSARLTGSYSAKELSQALMEAHQSSLSPSNGSLIREAYFVPETLPYIYLSLDQI